MSARCTTPCDYDCEATCHESHLPYWKREHTPAECRAMVRNQQPDDGGKRMTALAEALGDGREQLRREAGKLKRNGSAIQDAIVEWLVEHTAGMGLFLLDDLHEALLEQDHTLRRQDTLDGLRYMECVYAMVQAPPAGFDCWRWVGTLALYLEKRQAPGNSAAWTRK